MLGRKQKLQLTAIPLYDWLEQHGKNSTSIWNQRWEVMLQRGEKEELEEYLSSFCYSVLELNSEDQVFVVRTVFVSIITDILRNQSKRQTLQPKVLREAYDLIAEIESWENLSQFILGIPTFLNVIVDRLRIYSPFYGTCPQLDEAIRLIHTHITERCLSVQWLADQLNISTTHLSNLFRLQVGMNASDFIAKIKIAEIASEIVETSKPLAEIRQKFGFISHSHFIQFFKKHKGKTPLKYRQHIFNMSE